MTEIKDCTRCGSKIVEQRHNARRATEFIRYVENYKSVESKTAKLCSECHDDLWDFVFDSNVDRSDKADPMPLEKMSESVQRQVDDLQGVLESLEGATERENDG